MTDDKLHPLLDRWLAEADAGRLLPATELCRDCPELLHDAEREIAVLRQFHILARPSASTSDDVRAQTETTTEEPAVAVPLGPLPSTGSEFGRYQIIAELDKGGMGIIYKARDTQLNRDVALKVMRPETAAKPNTADRFLREARALAAIRHDHVVEIYDYGEMDGVRFVTMPLLAGESLETRLERESPLPASEVVRIGTELAEGLAAVHEKGLIHRDLKPTNVWLEAPNCRVKLLDFGLARDAETGDRLTRTGAIVGTPAYMSPEQVNGLDLDARTDLFSLGSVLYKAATGQLAFAAKTATATLRLVGEIDPPPARTVNPAIPTGLSDLIAWLHRKNPADRPPSAAEVVKALRRLATAPQTPTTDWRPGEAEGGRLKRRPNRVGVAGAIALGVCVIAGVLLYPSVRDRFHETRPDRDALLDQNGSSEPLRIGTLDVYHGVPKTKEWHVLGNESFGATVDDVAIVRAKLSRPAYCYLLIFRPDSKEEFLPPQDADKAPELTDEPRYPLTDRSNYYGLDDGNGGLLLVAHVASDKPLPPYTEWRKDHANCPWKRFPGQPGVVRFDDGVWLDTATPGSHRSRGDRGEKKDADAAPIVDLVDWLKKETGAVMSAVAFTVEGKR